MTPQNAASHLGLFCLLREFSSKFYSEYNLKITPDTPNHESRLNLMIIMGKSIRQIWFNTAMCICCNLVWQGVFVNMILTGVTSEVTQMKVVGLSALSEITKGSDKLKKLLKVNKSAKTKFLTMI